MKLRSNTTIIIACAALLPLFSASCTTSHTYPNTTKNIAIISNDTAITAAEDRLADAASDINSSLNQLAAIERTSHPQARMPSPQMAELIGMSQPVSIEWTGPIAPLVAKIAATTHYKLRVLGKTPAIPVLVSISAKDTPIADVLRDATFQCQDKANIVVYPASRTIELRYAKN